MKCQCTVTISVFAVSFVTAQAGDQKQELRPISEADTILAVGLEKGGFVVTPPYHQVILCIWPDGFAVWSGDRLNGGAPYFEGAIDPKKVTTLLARFEKDGLFADTKPKLGFGPDSNFNTILIKSGKNQFKMESWHEVGEESGGWADAAGGLTLLGDRRRHDVLRSQPADYLYCRLVWAETRASLANLLPAASKPSTGAPVKKAGVLSWQEGAKATNSERAAPRKDK